MGFCQRVVVFLHHQEVEERGGEGRDGKGGGGEEENFMTNHILHQSYWPYVGYAYSIVGRL